MADTNPGMGDKKQSGLSWSQPSVPSSTTNQSKPMGSPSSAPSMQKPAAVQPMKSSTSSVSPARSMHQPNPAGRIVGGFIGGLVVGVLITAIWFTSGSSGSTPASGTSTTTTTTTNATGGTSVGASTGQVATVGSMMPASSLAIASPQASGMQVSVTSATVSTPTWLVVYESSNGQPVRILGAAMFFPENNGKGGTIPLLRATQPGQTYVVGERTDNGDHMLSLTADAPVADSSGNAMWSSFKTN